MKFNILERIMILGVLPKQSDFVSMKIIDDLQRAVGFSQGELDKYNIKNHPNGSVSWDKTFDKEIKVTMRAAEIIKENLIKLSETKMVTAQHLSIYEKFGVEIEVKVEDAIKQHEMEKEYIGEKDVKNTKVRK